MNPGFDLSVAGNSVSPIQWKSPTFECACESLSRRDSPTTPTRESMPMAKKTLAQIQAQIDQLNREAEAIRAKEVAGVVQRI
jgi:hypothetical protein